MAASYFIQLFKPGDTVHQTCRCGLEYEFVLVLGRLTAIECPCGQWVGAGHDILIYGMDQYLEKTLGSES